MDGNFIEISMSCLIDMQSEHPDVEVNRSLILVAKTLQNIANLVEFSGDKEEYMVGMNEFVVNNITLLKKFIDELAVSFIIRFSDFKVLTMTQRIQN